MKRHAVIWGEAPSAPAARVALPTPGIPSTYVPTSYLWLHRLLLRAVLVHRSAAKLGRQVECCRTEQLHAVHPALAPCDCNEHAGYLCRALACCRRRCRTRLPPRAPVCRTPPVGRLVYAGLRTITIGAQPGVERHEAAASIACDCAHGVRGCACDHGVSRTAQRESLSCPEDKPGDAVYSDTAPPAWSGMLWVLVSGSTTCQNVPGRSTNPTRLRA